MSQEPEGLSERDLFEEWAIADHRCVQPEQDEERTPENGLYYIEDSTNHAYIGWRERGRLLTDAWNRPPLEGGEGQGSYSTDITAAGPSACAATEALRKSEGGAS